MQPRFKKILIFTVTMVALLGATLFYLDWRIPRATATVQVHPSAMAMPTHLSGPR